MKSGIYIIHCSKSSKVYIGSAINLENRKKKHFATLLLKQHNNKLQNAFNKYGESAFTFEILEYVKDKSKLIEREQYYLDTLLFASEKNDRFDKLSFNVHRKVDSALGVKMREDSKRKSSISHTGLKYKKQERKTCCFCLRKFNISALKQFHNENCKLNPERSSLIIEKEKIRGQKISQHFKGKTPWNKNLKTGTNKKVNKALKRFYKNHSVWNKGISQLEYVRNKKAA